MCSGIFKPQVACHIGMWLKLWRYRDSVIRPLVGSQLHEHRPKGRICTLADGH